MIGRSIPAMNDAPSPEPRTETVLTVLTVDVTHDEELTADGFDLFVTVRGSSVFTGSAAFEKAAEVKSLVSAVVAVGIVRTDVSLVGVHVDVESGLLSKSSSARYSLRVRASNSERLGPVLSAVAAARNATVDQLEWRYPEGESAKEAWLAAAVTKARGRAKAMAAALGLTIARVKSVRTPLEGNVAFAGGPVHMTTSYGMAKSRSRGDQVDLGLEVAPTKKVETSARVEFVAVAGGPDAT